MKLQFIDSSYTPPNLVFSYWILAFVIFYFLGFKKYNPLFLLIIGIIHNIFLLIIYLFIAPVKFIIIFIFVNTIIKVLPIYLLRNTMIQMKDIYFSLCLFLFFLFYISILYFVFGNKNAYQGLYTKNIQVGFLTYWINKLFYK